MVEGGIPPILRWLAESVKDREGFTNNEKKDDGSQCRNLPWFKNNRFVS